MIHWLTSIHSVFMLSQLVSLNKFPWNFLFSPMSQEQVLMLSVDSQAMFFESNDSLEIPCVSPTFRQSPWRCLKNERTISSLFLGNIPRDCATAEVRNFSHLTDPPSFYLCLCLWVQGQGTTIQQECISLSMSYAFLFNSEKSL